MFAGQRLQLQRSIAWPCALLCVTKLRCQLPQCRANAPLHPRGGDQDGAAPTPTSPGPGASLTRSAHGRHPQGPSQWRREPVSRAPVAVVPTHTFGLRDPPAAIPITARWSVGSKSQTGEIPATVHPRSGRAGPQRSPPPEVRSRGLRGNGRHS